MGPGFGQRAGPARRKARSSTGCLASTRSKSSVTRQPLATAGCGWAIDAHVAHVGVAGGDRFDRLVLGQALERRAGEVDVVLHVARTAIAHSR